MRKGRKIVKDRTRGIGDNYKYMPNYRRKNLSRKALDKLYINTVLPILIERAKAFDNNPWHTPKVTCWSMSFEYTRKVGSRILARLKKEQLITAPFNEVGCHSWRPTYHYLKVKNLLKLDK